MHFVLRIVVAVVLIGASTILGAIAVAGYTVERTLQAAEAARKHGEYDRSLTLLHNARRRAPHSAELLQAVGQTYRAAWYFRDQTELLDSAELAYRRAGQLNPLGATPHVELARTLTLAGRHDLADRAFQHALRRDPNNPGIIVDHAVALEQAGRGEDALHAYRRAHAIRPNTYSLEAEVRLGVQP